MNLDKEIKDYLEIARLFREGSGGDPIGVYFIRAMRGGEIVEIKIGYSEVPETRIKQLQRTSEYPLEIMTVIRWGPQLLEEALHLKFRHLRLHGEWFSPGSDLLEFIEGVRKDHRS